jgi:hypothetical protein
VRRYRDKEVVRVFVRFRAPLLYQQLVEYKSVNNWNDLPVLTKKIYSNP